MLRAVVIAGLACACGRVGFDPLATANGDAGDDGPPGDVLLGHDEDGDGVPDQVDFCPHLPETVQADQDGDLVGDACDPEPALARQRWQLFSPMGDDAGFMPTAATWTKNGDDWSYPDLGGLHVLIYSTGVPFTDVDVWVGATFESAGASGRQAAIIIRDPGNSACYYGELFESGGNTALNVIYYDGASYNAVSSTPLGGAFPLGRATLFLRARATASPQYVFDAQTSSGARMVATPVPNYAGALNMLLSFGQHSGRVHYIAIVETN